MPIESNENWSGRTLTISATAGWTATRNWTVTGARTEIECLSATPMDGSAIPGRLNSHPQNILLTVDNHNFTQTGPFTWTVTANYLIRAEDKASNEDAVNLLTLKPRIGFRKGTYGEPCDRAIDNKPIANTAGDAFDPPPQKIFRERYLRIWRYEPFYDIAKAEKFEDAVNSNQFTMGRIIVAPGDCLCDSIEPMEEYTADALAIPIAYDFVIRTRRDANGAKFSPFQTHILNKGRRGWWSPGTGLARSGEFCHADGTQVTEPVMLDMTGKPVDTSIKVLAGSLNSPELKDPIAAPYQTYPKKSPLTIDDKFISLQFDLYRSEDFAELGL